MGIALKMAYYSFCAYAIFRNEAPDELGVGEGLEDLSPCLDLDC